MDRSRHQRATGSAVRQSTSTTTSHDHQAVLPHTYSLTGLVLQATQSSQAKPPTIQYSVMEQHRPILTNYVLQKVNQCTMSACTYNLKKICIQDKLTLRCMYMCWHWQRETSMLRQFFVLPPDTFVHTHSLLSSRNPVYHIQYVCYSSDSPL